MSFLNNFRFKRIIDFEKKSLVRFSPLLILSVSLLVLSVINPPIFKNESSKKIPTVTKVTKNPGKEIKISTFSEKNSVKINSNSSTGTSAQEGTCTITKNGKTEIVPAGSVKVNEQSSGDINVKIDCNSSSTSSNKTSIKNNIDVKVNTSN